RILWHYVMEVFDRPRIYDSPKGENSLAALYTDVLETMEKRNVVRNDIRVWHDVDPHTLPLLVGWERGLLSKGVLKLFKFGDATFIAPAFYSDIDWRVIASAGKFSADKHAAMFDLVENLRKLPSFPIMKGTKDYELALGLQRAGAIKVVEDSKGMRSSHYAYIVSRDMFEKLDGEMAYKYSHQPFTEYGDSSV